MSYKIMQYQLKRKVKAFQFLIHELGFSMKEAQRLVDRKRVIVNGRKLTRKSAYISGDIGIVQFVPNSQNLLPIFQTPDFALFDKPSGVLIHPNSHQTDYSLTHEVKYLFGPKANITHRIDKETSGLVIVAKNRKAERKIKGAFEAREIKKGYLAYVHGRVESELFIDEPILKNSDFSEVKLKVYIHPEGKPSQTHITPLRYFKENDITLVEAMPLTGRQHQIRLHLFHVEHPIVGDPIYGISAHDAARYLDGIMTEEERIRLTGAKRLMLQANWIDFSYGNRFKIVSKIDFLEQINLCHKKQLL